MTSHLTEVSIRGAIDNPLEVICCGEVSVTSDRYTAAVSVIGVLIAYMVAVALVPACDQGEPNNRERFGFDVVFPQDLPSGIEEQPTVLVQEDGDGEKEVQLLYRSNFDRSILRVTESESRLLIPHQFAAKEEVAGVQIYLIKADDREWWAHFHSEGVTHRVEFRDGSSRTGDDVKSEVLNVARSMLK
jgi:hypothetical protein